MGKRLRGQRRGRGSVYLSPGHRHKSGIYGIKYPNVREVIEGRVIHLIHDPGRTAPLAAIKLENGRNTLAIASQGLKVNQIVKVGSNVELQSGNTLPVSQIPEGTSIYNIEANPGDGGKFVRAAGTTATIVSHGAQTVIQMPSGQFKTFNPNCRATIGVVAGSGRREKPFVKAGKRWHALRSRAQMYPTVRGVAMNPVNHPHGGGSHQHVGKPSTVPVGAPPGRKVGRFSPRHKKKR